MWNMAFDDILNIQIEILRFPHMLSCSTFLFYAESKEKVLHKYLSFCSASMFWYVLFLKYLIVDSIMVVMPFYFIFTSVSCVSNSHFQKKSQRWRNANISLDVMCGLHYKKSFSWLEEHKTVWE